MARIHLFVDSYVRLYPQGRAGGILMQALIAC